MIMSIDVGIKNLAMCIMTAGNKKYLETYEIHLWEVYDVLENNIPRTCNALLKGKFERYCSKKSSYKYKDSEKNDILCCKTHLPKNYKGIKIKEKNISNYLIQDIVSILLRKIETIYNERIEIFKQITEIYIELQPKINQKMKMISHVLFGKLIDIHKEYPEFSKIRFVSAKKKLRAYTGPYIDCKLKSQYSKRKWLSVEYTKWFLENKFCEKERSKWLECLNNTKKNDDMADTFLMSINAIFN